MKEFYQRISLLDRNKEHQLITVTGGDLTGLEVLLTDDRQVWSSGPDFDKVKDFIDPADIFRENLTQNTQLVVCGCGFVGQNVVMLGKYLGWNVTALDDREEYTQKARNAGADRVITGSFESSLASLGSGRNTCFVVVTREHECDKACLYQILRKPFGYLGMMGSHKRSGMMRDMLVHDGFEKQLVDRIYAPVGLEIGAQTPEEIAVSIISQIMQVRSSSKMGSSIPDALMESLKELCESDAHAVMAVVTSKKGSGPREPGTRMLVYPDAHTSGTIGGGLMEAEVIKIAVKALEDPSSFKAGTVTIDLSGKKGEPKQMLCGGVTKVFLEIL